MGLILARGVFVARKLLLFLFVAILYNGLAQTNRDFKDLRCPIESPGDVPATTLQRWPAVLELLELGMHALFQGKEARKAKRLFADALDVAQGRWDAGVPPDTVHDTAAVLLGRGFRAAPSAIGHASTIDSVSFSSSSLARAFRECALGVGATYRALAVAHMVDEKAKESQASWAQALAVAQRFFYLGYGWMIALYNEGPAKQEPEYMDLSLWPITGEEWETEKRYVADTLRQLGATTFPPRAGVPKNARIAGLRIAIVSVCAYPKGSLFPHLAASVHKTYTERHGYTYIHHRDEDGRFSANRPKAWSKVRAMHEALEDGRWDWVLWADCDIYFMDLETTLDSLLLRYASLHGAALSGTSARDHRESQSSLDPRVNMIITEDAQSLNTAIFLMKASTWSLQLLRRIWGMDKSAASSQSVKATDWDAVPTPFLKHPWWEQAAFTQELIGNNHRLYQEMPHAQVASASGGVLVPYPEQVRILPQKEVNSYHVISSRLDPETTWV